MTLNRISAPPSTPHAASDTAARNADTLPPAPATPALADLPHEVQHSLIEQLDTQSLASLASTNKALRAVAQGALAELTVDFRHPVFKSDRFLQNPGAVLGPYTGVRRLVVRGSATPQRIDALRRAVQSGACRGVQTLHLRDLWPCREDGHLGALLSEFPKMRALTLPGQSLGEADLQRILTLGQIENLDLAGLHADLFTHEAVERIGAMSELQSLRLPWCNALDDRAMSALSRLAKLQRLEFSGADQVTVAGFAALGRLTGLGSLSICGCDLTDEALGFLGSLDHLEHLDLRGNPRLTGASLDAAGSLTKLKSLDLARCENLDSQALEAVARNKDLRELNLTGCGHLTDRDLARLSGLNRLEVLDLRGLQQLTADGLRHLSGLSSLRRLNLGGCQRLENASMAHLGQLGRLTFLGLEDCSLIGDEGLAHLEHLSQLEELWLTACGPLSDRGMESLGRLGSMKALMLSVWNANQVSITGLGNLLNLPKLERLELPFRFHGALSPEFSPVLHALERRGCELQF